VRRMRAALLRGESSGVSKRQTAESECQDCHERILWASVSTGGRIPLDLIPTKIMAATVRPVYLLNDLEMICTKADASVIEQAIEKGGKLYTNHLATCEKRHGVSQ